MSEWSAAEYAGRALPERPFGSCLSNPGNDAQKGTYPQPVPSQTGRCAPDTQGVSQPNTEGALMTLPPDVLTRPCVCGRSLTASRTAPYDGVSRHARTPEHRSWWVRVRDDWQGQP